MLEVRYNKETKEITGWCGDEKQFGNLKKRWGVEEIAILDIPVPKKELDAYFFNTVDQALIDNPDYIPIEPFNAKAEIDKLKVKVEKLERESDKLD